MLSLTTQEIIEWIRQVAPQADLHSDTRALRAGDVFFALPIGHGDGRHYIAQAISNGALAIVYEADDFSWDAAMQIPHLAVQGLQQQLGYIANAYYQQPDKTMLSIAVTGTNGKTSCSQWLASAFSQVYKKSAVIGTLGVGCYQAGQVTELQETGFTTPDALQLHRQLRKLSDVGAEALAIEASSIGLQQGRMNGLHIDVAVFTNLTRDHLDYHGDMKAYGEAKSLLFDWDRLQTAVINSDDAFGLELIARLKQSKPGVKIFAYGMEPFSAPDVPFIHASNVKSWAGGTAFHVDSSQGNGLIKTQLVGRFNVSNALAVLATLLAQNVRWTKAAEIIEKLRSVPGRMQKIGSPGQAMVVVDYAHTPDALEKTLLSLRQVAQERGGNLWCVFGCGGDRDPGKRPQMGKVAELADHTIVTSDNPRTENPDLIIQQIVQGMQTAPVILEDRAKAILYAIKHAGNQDVVLLAGKGHEAYQDINGKKWPFSDEEHALLAMATVATSGNIKKAH